MHKNQLSFVLDKLGIEVSEELTILSLINPDWEENLTAVCGMLIFISISVFSMFKQCAEAADMQVAQWKWHDADVMTNVHKELMLDIICQIINVQCDLNTIKHPD